MDIIGLISGGKDSCYNLMCAVKEGHRIAALANLHPAAPKELDSYMYQTVGSEGIAVASGFLLLVYFVFELYSEAMGIPLYRRVISGMPLNKTSKYVVSICKLLLF